MLSYVLRDSNVDIVCIASMIIDLVNAMHDYENKDEIFSIDVWEFGEYVNTIENITRDILSADLFSKLHNKNFYSKKRFPSGVERYFSEEESKALEDKFIEYCKNNNILEAYFNYANPFNAVYNEGECILVVKDKDSVSPFEFLELQQLLLADWMYDDYNELSWRIVSEKEKNIKDDFYLFYKA